MTVNGKRDIGRGPDLLRRTPGFCLLPWTHLHVQTDGKVSACCDFQGELGDVRRTGLDRIWDGAEMHSPRARMLRGETIAGCVRCLDRERSVALSIRQATSDCTCSKCRAPTAFARCPPPSRRQRGSG